MLNNLDSIDALQLKEMIWKIYSLVAIEQQEE
jgi:hypothetical protein